MNLVKLLEMNAAKFKTKDCLRFNGQGLTFEQLLMQAEKAAGLLQMHGINKSDKVAIMSRNLPEFVISFYGALKAGAAVVPINHKLMSPEVDYILQHSEAKVLLFDGILKEVIEKVETLVPKIAFGADIAGYPLFTELMATSKPGSPVAISDEDIAEILYTSGTTGKPKGCLHAHKNVIMAGITGALAMKMDAEDRLFMAMPIWHSSPLNNWFMGAQYVGAVTIMIPEYHPLHFLQTIQTENCSVYFGAPISYVLPIQMIPNFDQFDLTSMRCWIYGGGPMSADTALSVMKAYKSDNFYQVYGMTEAGPTGSVLFPSEQVPKAGSIGCKALPGAALRLKKLDGSDVGPGEVGEIQLKADSMMQGYFKDQQSTQNAFEDGWYKTGDMAQVDEEGYLFIVDRIKDMIITGGENVYSKEVEDAIMANPAVMEAAVIGVPHPDWGETVTAMVVAKQGQVLAPDDLHVFLSDRLAKYKIPRKFVVLDALPHTPSGKIMKYKLRESFS